MGIAPLSLHKGKQIEGGSKETLEGNSGWLAFGWENMVSLGGREWERQVRQRNEHV